LYTGKHAAKDPNIVKIKQPQKPKKKGYLRVFLLWSFMVFLVLASAGFMYAQFIEERLHGDMGPDSVIAGDEENAIKYLDNRNDDSQPVTFLLLGSDSRGVVGEPARSDTIMVLRLNPEKKIGYLISIPRDSWVKIKGHGEKKINAAYQYGGPNLMIDTVRNFTGLDINHYAIIDFQGFKEIVDALGGIDIDVEKDLRDRKLHMDLNSGYQHLDGEEALKYVRIRYCDDDFGRIGRQQKFLKAVMDKLLRLSSVFRIPQLASIASQNIRTDSELGIPDIIGYGQMIRSIGRNNIHMVTVPGTPEMKGAASVVVPDKQKVAWIFERAKNDLPLELTADEKMNNKIKVDIQNGSGRAGVAKAMADKLTALNLKIKEIGNAESFNYYETRIIATPEKEALARKVQSLMGFGRVSIKNTSTTGTDTQSPDNVNGNASDVLVIVGRDFTDGP
jgi:LCP family protein required for cell wall assembly